ncbi:hypothetical protein Rcae01_02382 [Novipirellula caenicola]|uniref:Cytochrome c domain-containing protein n=2 Tax=Novipirellula caenicola TaxID=1536901 RepID=A0ABP9VP18_9BACT
MGVDPHVSNRICRHRVFMALMLVGVLSLTATDAFAQRKKPSPPKPPKIKLPASVLEKTPVQMDVAKVEARSRAEIHSASRAIDRAVEAKLASEGLSPNAMASDEVFMRRVYLDVAGRIPSLAEATEFLQSTHPDRREDLIDQLLNSPDYVSNMYNLWADVLRLVERPSPDNISDPYLAYVKESICSNKPYDKWVYEMLTATGKAWENPAVGFQLRDDLMPLAYVDNTVRVFLGTQIGCAQCHDHPFDQWTQYQFYQLAAMTAGTRTRIGGDMPGYQEERKKRREFQDEAKRRDEKGRFPSQYRRVMNASLYDVREVKAVLKLPHDYAYSDAKPLSPVKPAVLWDDVPAEAKSDSPREQFAAWVTSPENPKFSRMIANRLWKRFIGVGVIEPIDDFNEDNPCANEELLDLLSEQMVRGGFDLKQFIRAILYSNTYQREASDYEVTSGELYYAPGPVVRRMTAEQVWDSILTMAVHNPWPFQRPTAEDIAPYVSIDFRHASFDQVTALADQFKKTYDIGTYRRSLNQHAYQGNVLCRASELPSPLPADHFLRQFGQGNRESIQTAEQEPTVPQTLAMFNGPITHVMLEPGSAIVDNVLAIDKTKDRIDAIFLSVLGRMPTQKDRLITAKELSQMKNDNVGYGNIIWALLNTREFLFVQ